MAGKIPVEIRYFTSGITWKADYVGIANQDETKLDLTGYVRVHNDSGELYDNAQTRLVVGTINLVEKIAELAHRPAPGKEGDARRNVLLGSLEKAMDGDRSMTGMEPPADGPVPKPMPATPDRPKEVKKQGLSEYFLFTIDGREDIKNNEPKQLVAMKVAEIPLECVYKLSDRTNAGRFDKYYRFANEKLVDEKTGEEIDLTSMENLGLSPLPDGSVRLYFKYPNADLAYAGGTTTKYVPIGDRLEVNVGADKDITIVRRLKDQEITNVTARQYKRHTSHTWAEYYDLIDYDETFTFEEEIISGKSAVAMVEVERRFNADVTLWGSEGKPEDWDSDKMGAYVDLHELEGRVERVDQNHIKYFLDMQPGEKRVVTYTVTHKQRKIGPKLNGVSRRESIRVLPKDQEGTGPTPRDPIPPPNISMVPQP